MSKISTIKEAIAHLPIHESAFMNTSDVIFSEEVRKLCEQNKCGLYGKSWACPPAIGNLADCQARCLAFKQAFIFSTATELEKRYDMEGWKNASRAHEKLTEQVVRSFKSQVSELLALSTEGCFLCETCTYPDAPCRQPERMYPATEGYGIMMIQQAKKCSINYYNGKDSVTFFSMIFFNGEEYPS